MLNKLGSFRSHAIIEIQTLVGAHFTCWKQSGNLDYIAEVIKKDKFLYNNIENVSNKSHYYGGFAYRLINYI